MNSAPHITHLLYLHGFRSSPQSTKARLMAQHVARQYPITTWWCPQLPPSPKAAIDLVMSGIAGWPRESMGVVGSSLGGFYATCVAQKTGCRAVLLNPAVHPARDLANYIGEQVAWHHPNAHFYFRPEYIDELRALDVGPLTHPERVFAVIAKGDEVLDWREMSGRYPGSPQKIVEGEDHALSDFERRHLGDVLAFLNPS
ncbi:YqiA/YcfP family alpha/beta fold hydrolase [Variovorax ureilyticus]|uniref:YqiA/YcfP family alpha/beta fold hydrolase n=1 Tax=Variovorax ureilyticus TaxID=1836198 RepID=A0ABU8VIU4_9BURK